MHKFLMSAAVLAISFNSAMAQGVPTNDVQNTLQTIKQFQVMLDDAGLQSDQLNQLVEHGTKLQAQLDQLNQLYAKLTGLRNIAEMTLEGGLDGILNGNLTDLVSTFKSVAHGNFSGFDGGKLGAMQQSVEEAYEAAGISQPQVSAMAASKVPGAQRTATQAASGAVLAASAQQTYKEAGIGLRRVDKIIDMAANSKDVKESIDLNTRMLGEVVLLLAKNLEATSLQSAYMGMSGVNASAAIAEERAYMTFSNQ